MFFISPIISYARPPELLEKKLAAEQFILQYEGEFIYVAKPDGVLAKDGSTIYTIGYGTRSYKGERITLKEGEKRFLWHNERKVFIFVDPDLPINEYVALSSVIYRTGEIIADCKDIKKYIWVTVIDEVTGKPKKVISKGLVNRARKEYNLCKGVKDEGKHINKTHR